MNTGTSHYIDVVGNIAWYTVSIMMIHINKQNDFSTMLG